jgi:phage terminase small subunit
VTDKRTLMHAEDAAKLGPAMRALPNERMREFVRALVQTGCSPARAAEAAGYGVQKSDGHARRLAHDPRVQAALHEEGIKAIRAHSVAGIRILAEIAADTNEAARDRIAAIRELMSRGGFAQTTEHNVTVTHRSEQEIDAELLALATEMGFSDEQKARLLGRPVVRKVDTVVIENETGGSEEPPVSRAQPGPTEPSPAAPSHAVPANMSEVASEVSSQESREGIEDLLPPLEPLANESGIESDFNPEDEGDEHDRACIPTR